jgi:alpha-glucosidase
MQWNTSKNAGFSTNTPWLPVPASYKTHNVETELKEPDSILNFYKRVLALRHHDPALRDGDYIALNEDDPNVLSYLRKHKDDAVLVVLNMSASPQTAKFDLKSQGVSGVNAKTLLTTMKTNRDSANLGSIVLEPFGVYIGKVE